MQNTFNTPVLIILFSRLEFSKQILEKVRAIGATKLFIACDKWSDNVDGEKEKVFASREYFKNNIDRDCIVTNFYLDKKQDAAIVVNIFFGTILNAAFGIANQVNNYINMFVRNLSQAAVPQIMKSHSGGDVERSINMFIGLGRNEKRTIINNLIKIKVNI